MPSDTPQDGTARVCAIYEGTCQHCGEGIKRSLRSDETREPRTEIRIRCRDCGGVTPVAKHG